MGTKNMAAEMNTVVEGPLKYRDGKKWKSRYCVIKKPSPVADRLSVSLYKDHKDLSHNGQPKTTFFVEDYFGIEADLTVDKENCVMALICQKSVSIFAFDHREVMLHFEISIRCSLGQDHQYPVQLFKVPTHSKLPLGVAQLHIQGLRFCLTAHSPPKLLMSWKIPELRRYGIVDGRFMFEGGSMCGKGSGVHGFESCHVEEINRNFLSSGRFPARKPLMWQRNKPQNQHVDNDGHTSDPQKLNAEPDFRAYDRMRFKRHSAGVIDYRLGVEMVEKKRLMSIENMDRRMRIYDIPPQLVRKVDSDPSVPDDGTRELSSDDKLAVADMSKKNYADNIPSNQNTGDRNKFNRNNRNSGEGTRSNRNSGDGTRSNRNSGDGTRSNRNSGDGARSNRNSGDGTRSNRNSGDGTRSNRNSGDGRRSKRNSIEGSRSNRNSDSSHSSRSSGDGSRSRPRRYSGESGHSYWHSDIAHRTSLALRRSLDNILAGNQNWIEDFDSEFKENSLSRSNLYKSTSALCTRLSESDSVLIEDEVVQARSGSVLMEVEDLHAMSGAEEEVTKSDVNTEVFQMEGEMAPTEPDMDSEMVHTEPVVIGQVVQAKSVVIKDGVQMKSDVKKEVEQTLAQSDVIIESVHIQHDVDSSVSEAKSDNVLPEDNVIPTHDDVLEENKEGKTVVGGVIHTQSCGVPLKSEVVMNESFMKQGGTIPCGLDNMSMDNTAEQQTQENAMIKGKDEKHQVCPPCVGPGVSVCGMKDNAIGTLGTEDCSPTPSSTPDVGSSSEEAPAVDRGSRCGLEELTHQEEILLHEMDLLDEMLQVCVDDKDDDLHPGNGKTCKSRGFADALSTLTIDTCWTEDKSDSTSTERSNSACGYTENLVSMLSPNLPSKVSRIPSCSKLAAPLPYVNLDKYDLGFKTSDHVDVSKVPLVRRGLSYDNLMSASNSSRERYSFRTKSLSCSDSTGSCASLSSDVFTRRYPPPLPPKKRKEESPPPKLPPKGPNLLRRQKGTSGLFNSVEDGQPRRKLSKPAVGRCEAGPQYQTPRSFPTRVSKPVPPLPEPEEPYMLMSDIIPKAVSPNRGVFTCPPVEELAEEDPKSSYMDMSALLDIWSPVLPKCSSGPEIHRATKVSPKVIRSQSVRVAVEENRKPRLFHSHSAEPYSENYMEMSAPGLADDSDSWLTAGEEGAKAAMPFSDLITVQSYRSSQKIELSGIGGSASNNHPTLNNSGADKLDSSSASNKPLSFLSRFIRTKNKKSSTSNSDNADSSMSESVVGKNKSDVPLAKASNRSASICYQNQTNLLAPPSGADRKRSSSFPNAAVFLENKKGENENGDPSSGKTEDKMDKRGSQSEDKLLSLLKKETSHPADNAYSPYWNMAPLQITCTSTCNENKSKEKPDPEKIDKSSKSTTDSVEKKKSSSVQLTTQTETFQKDFMESIQERLILPPKLHKIPSALILDTNTTMRTSELQAVDTNGLVPETDYHKLSYQTDDEKLLALAKVTKQEPQGSEVEGPAVIGVEGKMSASEEAAAIAEYVAALPPFIPPKTKPHYPGGLSPVIEVLATNPAELTATSVDTSVPKLVKVHPNPTTEPEKAKVLSDAASRKRKARETLRIMPPLEDENGNIWIPRGSLKRSEAVNGHGVPGEDGMNTASRRNDPLHQVKEHLDALSLASSHGSSQAASPSTTRAEDTPLRSSPASTTLRPRSGKEYHRIDRRRLADDHSPSSCPCPITPQSPSTASIFTFDTPSSPSIRSILSREGESPASSPSIMRNPYPCHSYVNLGKGSDNRPNLYVNIDMTPPNSPFRRTHMPLEQIDPQLNYAEIDLSQAGSDRSRKAKKGVQKAATIEYAMIDMVATAAVSKTRKEQDSLRCSGRKFSAPASVIVKERRTLGSGSFREKDRARKLSTSSVDSNG